jgi:hypothetical protein
MTQSGCRCEPVWRYADRIFRDGRCANPDGDPHGDWCFVDLTSCTAQRVTPWPQTSDDPWDYCVKNQ